MICAFLMYFFHVLTNYRILMLINASMAASVGMYNPSIHNTLLIHNSWLMQEFNSIET